MYVRCHNCGSTMGKYEPCPECGHYDGEGCECRYCVETQYLSD